LFSLANARKLAKSHLFVFVTEYRTAIDSFLKVLSYGWASSGPAYFIVKTKGDKAMEFDASDDSRIQAVGKQEARIWAQSDIKGNHLTVPCMKDAINSECRPDKIS
jgi:hypothetical protein